MLHDSFDDKRKLVQIMTWCRRATSHYLNQFDPEICRYMGSQGHNELKAIVWYCFYLSMCLVIIQINDNGKCVTVEFTCIPYKQLRIECRVGNDMEHEIPKEIYENTKTTTNL